MDNISNNTVNKLRFGIWGCSRARGSRSALKGALARIAYRDARGGE